MHKSKAKRPESELQAIAIASERCSRNLYQKLVLEKLVTVSGTYDMQSCINFF